MNEPNWNELIDPFYVYQIKVTDVYDGDTITCDINLGFNLDLKQQKIRLYGINAPERRGHEKEQGMNSRNVQKVGSKIKMWCCVQLKGEIKM